MCLGFSSFTSVERSSGWKNGMSSNSWAIFTSPQMAAMAGSTRPSMSTPLAPKASSTGSALPGVGRGEPTARHELTERTSSPPVVSMDVSVSD